MDTRKQSSITEMQVTSIRLEAELKERLREIAKEQGYQALIRNLLWQYVEQQNALSRKESSSHTPLLSLSDIRATFAAIAQQEEQCAITGQCIRPRQTMWLGLTNDGNLVPLAALPT
ncbi:hypothetical protein [Dendronalium sp. ChiSLP03b]|uniref:hypothetical protein n=1 Tax=Dendronalium sp. ChiSLP03b TaxID=3075381 RepID=UPI002AD53ACF|nr:hypothetical protein [Dendronalium sp. ChiSLP03b]MDZ8205052.1 hypothetical protein [Dendronalium sp. ChiSLP03b]